MIRWLRIRPNIHVMKLWWLWLILLALPALWPFYSEGLPRSFDGGLHLLRLSLLDQQMRQGNLLPRWTPSLILGYGYPLFNFYAPGAYYLAVLLHWVGFDLYHAFLGAFIAQILLAGGGMYLLARDTFLRIGDPTTDGDVAHKRRSEWAALVAAVAYLYGPYLLTNVYIRGAIAEAGAQALLPWIFWGVIRLLQSERPAQFFLLVGATLGALAITHNITLLFLPPVLLLFTLLQWLHSPQRWRRLPWLVGAFLVAMGLSAFFWLPLLVERHELAETAYLISRQVWLPGSVWTWQNFLDTGFHFTHTFARPIKVGLAQLVLALVGFLLGVRFLRRQQRLGDWLFWLAVAVGVGAFMGAWALPVWLSNDILPVAQFTWRLLSILSIPLALFVGGIGLAWPRTWQTILVAGITIVVVIVAQRPQLAWMDVYAAESATVSAPVFAQIELDKGVITGGHRNSSIQEFRPRWADTDLVLADDVSPPPVNPVIRPLRANAYALTLDVDASASTFLRFATFYFPGWEVRIDGVPQEIYPSTNLGLLTVDLPAGTSRVTVDWVGTRVQRAGGYLSLLTLGLLCLLCLWRPQLRWWVLLPALLLCIGGGTQLRTLPLQPVTTPTAPVDWKPDGADEARLSLRGLRLEEVETGYLHLYPYWQVTERLPATLTMHWQLSDSQGTVVSAAYSRPYFNAIGADSWAPGMLMDDRQRLPLPTSLQPDTYELALQLLEGDNELTAMVPVATYQLTEQPLAAPQPEHPLALRYGDQIELVGYTLRADGELLDMVDADSADTHPAVVRAGQYLRTTLYWQATGLIDHNYHAFVHLTDIHGVPLVQEDQLPGPLFHAPQLWNGYRAHNDSYLLRIPADAPSGLYWPGVGVYDFATLDRLPIPDSDADRHLLPPMKVLGEVNSEPANQSNARFGDMATLLGYTLSGAAQRTESVQVGDTMTVTLYWQSDTPTDIGYTRFIQVYNPDLGMAAQFDSPPQAGANPTWAWVPEEVIVDEISLAIQPDTIPGRYAIYTGFYNPADGVRLPVYGADGSPDPANWVQVGEIIVE